MSLRELPPEDSFTDPVVRALYQIAVELTEDPCRERVAASGVLMALVAAMDGGHARSMLGYLRPWIKQRKRQVAAEMASGRPWKDRDN